MTPVTLEGAATSARKLIESVHAERRSIAAEYPLVFDDDFPGRLVALGESGAVHSACAVLPREFLVDGLRVRGGLIGSVVTDPAHRGQGLATRNLVAAEAELQSEGCAFALLWAEDPAFYLARGYCPVGAEEDFVLPAHIARALPEPSGARRLRPEDEGFVHALYAAHPTRLERTPAETAALLACPEMTTLVLERDGEPVAYACRGRGRDLTDAIHEWGGPVDDVLALVRAHYIERFPEPQPDDVLFLMAPPAATELVYRLASLGAASTRGMLGLGKILDRSAAVRLLAQRLGDTAAVELADTPDGERIRIVAPERTAEIDDDGMLALLFAVTEVRTDVVTFLQGLGLNAPRLPLEPFAWGLDSI